MTARVLTGPVIEDRLAEFTELVAPAISNSASREQLARLAEEQAALRRWSHKVSLARALRCRQRGGRQAVGADLAEMFR